MINKYHKSEEEIRTMINTIVNEIFENIKSSAEKQRSMNEDPSMRGGRRRRHRGGMISVPEVGMNVKIDVDGHEHNGKSGKITGIGGDETIEVTLNNVNSNSKHIVIPGLTGDQLNQVVTEAELAALESNAANSMDARRAASNLTHLRTNPPVVGGRRRRKSKKSQRKSKKSKKSQRKSKKSQKKNQ
jgi:hypothetical protein